MTAFKYLLVGDRYASFAKTSAVLTPALLDTLHRQGARLPGAQVVIGQGLDRKSMPMLVDRLTAMGVEQVVTPKEHASLALTHKRHLDHVLISQPQQLDAAQYAFDLLLDDASDRLSDHVTGQHMGAMLLIEAARQVGIAVIECHCAGTGGRRWGLVLETMNCRFENYAFPVPTRLLASVHETDAGESRRSLLLCVRVVQAERAVAEVEIRVTLFREDLLARMEERRSSLAIGEALATMQTAQGFVAEDLVL